MNNFPYKSEQHDPPRTRTYHLFCNILEGYKFFGITNQDSPKDNVHPGMIYSFCRKPAA
jgi:hypothetical protein